MADKYEVLAALIEAQAQEIGDQAGWHYLSIGILRDLHDWENGDVSSQDLPAAIYDRIQGSVDVTPFDDELKPGEYDPRRGEYNPNE